jgi:hypothetical protein
LQPSHTKTRVAYDTISDHKLIARSNIHDDASDPDYQSVAKLVREAVVRAWQAPRRDLEVLAPQMVSNFK